MIAVAVERDSSQSLDQFCREFVNPLADLNAAMMVVRRQPLKLRMRIKRGMLFMFAAWGGQRWAG